MSDNPHFPGAVRAGEPVGMFAFGARGKIAIHNREARMAAPAGLIALSWNRAPENFRLVKTHVLELARIEPHATAAHAVIDR
jgi:hypothetical protein